MLGLVVASASVSKIWRWVKTNGLPRHCSICLRGGRHLNPKIRKASHPQRLEWVSSPAVRTAESEALRGILGAHSAFLLERGCKSCGSVDLMHLWCAIGY